jgi:hypothetical protein
MSMPTIPVILYDTTSGANAALDTGKIDLTDFADVSIHLISAAVVGTPAVSYEVYDASGTAVAIDTANLTTGSTRAVGGWGPGCSYTKNGLLGIASSLPGAIRLQVAALGAAVTGRLIIRGRKTYRGRGP